MGIDDDGIKKVGQDVEKVTLGLLEEMVDEDSELISIYYGEDTTKEQAEALLEKVEETYGDCDVQLEYGGQANLLFLIISRIREDGKSRLMAGFLCFS